MTDIFSIMTTLAPKSCARIAAANPAPPLPTITISKDLSSGSPPSAKMASLLDLTMALVTAFLNASH